MKKIIISFVVGATLMFVASVYAITTTFNDVNQNDWFYNDVSNLANWGVVEGYPDGSYKPANYVTRAELAAMLNRYDRRVRETIAEGLEVATDEGYLDEVTLFPNYTIIDYYLEDLGLNYTSIIGASCDQIDLYKESINAYYDYLIKINPEETSKWEALRNEDLNSVNESKSVCRVFEKN